jgi:hypothetical protein
MAKKPAKKASKKSAKKASSKTGKPAAKGGKGAAWKNSPARLAFAKKAAAMRAAGQTVLLSGGNPQIPKGDGDAPVQAYIAAMPEWKSAMGRALDAVISRAMPNVVKAVRWNSPFYGTSGDGSGNRWYISFHCLTKYIKVAFHNGASLTPLPPVESKHKNTRYLHLYEGDAINDAQLTAWVKQAAKLPGWDGISS